MIGFFKKGLQKTLDAIKDVVPIAQEKIEKELLETILLEADMEYELIEEILEPLPNDIKRDLLAKTLLTLFSVPTEISFDSNSKPFVELIIGVNGAGKTTTIAKLANLYKKKNLRVMLGAGDTFRAAAIEQLKKWAEILSIPIIFSKQGHDPSAVAYDCIESAKAKGIDIVLLDTAGRLQNQTNLSNELKKIIKVSSKAKETAPDRKLLIIDGTQGNQAINQALAFNEIVGIDGVIITKLDGTAKGGAIFSIAKRLEIPILYMGIGEKADDLVEFNPKEFIDSLLDGIYIK
jgi:fused signal recognition particle receptor